MYPPETLDEIAMLCKQHGAWLVVDEAYEHFLYDGKRWVEHLRMSSALYNSPDDVPNTWVAFAGPPPLVFSPLRPGFDFRPEARLHVTDRGFGGFSDLAEGKIVQGFPGTTVMRAS